MKQQFLEALKTKFDGVSDRILGRMADRLAKTATATDDVQSVVDNVTFQQILEQYGDSRATEAQQTAIKTYESKYGLKDGKPTTEDVAKATPQDATEAGNDIPAWAQSLIESNKALSAQVAAMQGERVTADRRAQLSEITANLPQAIRKAYNRTPIDQLTDEQFEALKGEVTAEAAEIAKETATRGAVFGRPTVQGGTQTQQQAAGNKEATQEEAQAVVDKLGV